MPTYHIDSFLYGNTEVTYTVRRSKELDCIKITVRGPMVEVSAPAGMRSTRIQSHILKKADWVIQKLDLARHQKPFYPSDLQSGVAIHFFGRQYQLRIKPTAQKRGKIVVRARQIELLLPSDATSVLAQSLIKEEMRKMMQERLPKLLEHFAAILGIHPPPFQVRELGNRWGSCTQSGKICFHWLLATQEMSFVEKVVAHELCHLIEPRHSAKFKKLMQKIHPC